MGGLGSGAAGDQWWASAMGDGRHWYEDSAQPRSSAYVHRLAVLHHLTELLYLLPPFVRPCSPWRGATYAAMVARTKCTMTWTRLTPLLLCPIRILSATVWVAPRHSSSSPRPNAATACYGLRWRAKMGCRWGESSTKWHLQWAHPWRRSPSPSSTRPIQCLGRSWVVGPTWCVF